MTFRATKPCLAVTAMALFTVAASAQLPVERPPEAQAPIRANVEVVNVDVTVTDARGNFVGGLKCENFLLLDEGAEQRITHFAALEAPATVLVLVETSPAVYLLHRQHLDAAYALLDGLGAEDQAALASYDESARMLLPFSADKRAVAGAIGALRYNLGRTELKFYDAIEAALGWLAPIPGKKALVLLTTGLDSSGKPWESLRARLGSSEVAVYAVALGGELREFKERPLTERDAAAQDTAGASPQLSFEEADRVLREMTAMTGGQAFFPRKASELEGIYRMIASTLRHRYSLGFAPTVRDGRFHRVFVQMVDDRGRVLGPHYAELSPDAKPQGKSGVSPKRVRYRILARRGYVAPGP